MSTAENQQIKDIIDCFLNFRMTIRNRALEQNPKDIILLKECDNARMNLSTYGIVVKVKLHKIKNNIRNVYNKFYIRFMLFNQYRTNKASQVGVGNST